MVDTVLMIGAFLAAFYALTFARWLKQGGNKQGAYVVFLNEQRNQHNPTRISERHLFVRLLCLQERQQPGSPVEPFRLHRSDSRR